MAGKKDFKAVEKRLERLGFTYDHTNSSSQFVYTHPDHPDVPVAPGISDSAGRLLMRRVENALGQRARVAKRNPGAVKERQAVAREQLRLEAERLESERAEIILRRDALFAGAGAHLSNREIRQLELRVREIEVRTQEIQRLMCAPVTGANLDRRATHQGGAA